MKKLSIPLLFFIFAISATSQTLKNNHLSSLSYENRQKPNLYTSSIPVIGDARAFFKYSDGTQGLVITKLTTWPGNGTLETAKPTITYFYRQINGQWVDITSIVFDDRNSVPGCTHSRKTIAADFNQDGIVDFAIACTGWDDRPFPGERSRILLSQPDGKWRLDYLSNTAAYQHAGASADINGDGFPDLILSNINGVDIFINDGTGHFLKSTDLRIPQQRRGLIFELFDANSDGKFDFIAGSHEWEDASRIIINPGNNNFGGSYFNRPMEIVIPAVSGAGVIVDFLYVQSKNVIYVLRTGDGKAAGTRFYEGVWLQKFDLTTRISSTVYANPSWSEPGRPNNKWIRWIIERDGFITSDFGELIKISID